LKAERGEGEEKKARGKQVYDARRRAELGFAEIEGYSERLLESRQAFRRNGIFG
jgi:hypothetical protein